MSLVNLAHVCSHIQNVTRVSKSLTSIPFTKLHLQVALGLYKEGFISSIQRGSLTGPDKEYTAATPDNISTRRLWLGLKYHNTKSVISEMHLVSHPNKRVFAKPQQVVDLLAGKKLRQINPPKLGEVMFIRTKEGDVLELQEAAQKHLGGELLCRVS
ncbi:hypothetical protein DV113_000245 [Geotrichum candidum]|uniref:Similar to Saccharomyces cerevisiae YMR158W MRPS8 Mitochondrial ribosomal protein of the small subunit n=1 Tax=Geotrichum candidum TaxID=1173061 RepID=A0A0J9XES7_GEOCN|nr:hypothetical protein DV113_000245 [Geotrichum candidum]KAI8135608.1 hypothetical protein DUD61_000665 [Geotrichum candidum]CDO55742.1 similar to Saccharomyces cerevisiae YMR158W MRPS8 Mitochondrial ribosomal protein of the small subunit [Geotrichum candidum]